MNSYALDDLLPHAGGMMLLDNIISFDDQSLVAQVTVKGNGLFGDGKTVPALVGIEYMAQAISAHSGMMDKLAGRQSYLGFLLGTRLYRSSADSFLAGSVLTVSVKIVLQEQGLGVFDCKITAPDVLVEAKLNVYQPKSEKNRVLSE